MYENYAQSHVLMCKSVCVCCCVFPQNFNISVNSGVKVSFTVISCVCMCICTYVCIFVVSVTFQFDLHIHKCMKPICSACFIAALQHNIYGILYTKRTISMSVEHICIFLYIHTYTYVWYIATFMQFEISIELMFIETLNLKLLFTLKKEIRQISVVKSTKTDSLKFVLFSIMKMCAQNSINNATSGNLIFGIYTSNTKAVRLASFYSRKITLYYLRVNNLQRGKKNASKILLNDFRFYAFSV